MRRNFTQIAIIIGVFGAASVAGGVVKIPGPLGSVAFDSMPGYFVAGFFGPLLGGVVGSLGHLASALSGGFPLGHLHFVVATAMFAACAAFGLLFHRIGPAGPFAAFAAALLVNGVAAPLLLVPFGTPLATALAYMPILILATAFNAGVAAAAAWLLSRLPQVKNSAS